MAFPTGWDNTAGQGLKRTDNLRSLRVFINGLTGGTPGPADTNFANNAFSWFQGGGDPNVWVPIDSDPMTAPGAETTQKTFGFSPSGLAVPQSAFPGDTPPSREVVCRMIKISNSDGTNNLEFSFDGVTVHGILLPGEIMDFVERFERGIALRSSAATCQYRLWAW